MTIRCLEGLYNINRKVIDRVTDYVVKHPDELVRVYCCVDRESRYDQVPGFDIQVIIDHIRNESIERILSIDAIVATKQIESWFFYDIGGIFSFLRVPRAQRKPKAYKPPERYGYKELQRLFERYGKTYSKGKRAGNFIEHLDLGKIVDNCRKLERGIALIRDRSGDIGNHLFGGD